MTKHNTDVIKVRECEQTHLWIIKARAREGIQFPLDTAEKCVGDTREKPDILFSVTRLSGFLNPVQAHYLWVSSIPPLWGKWYYEVILYVGVCFFLFFKHYHVWWWRGSYYYFYYSFVIIMTILLYLMISSSKRSCFFSHGESTNLFFFSHCVLMK